MTTSTITARRKGDPQHYVEEKNNKKQRFGDLCITPPIPGVSTSLLPGGKQIRNKRIFDEVLWFLWKKRSKKYFAKGAKKGVPAKSTTAVFPRGSKKRKSNNDDKHDHGREKRRPSTLCWGNENNENMDFEVFVSFCVWFGLYIDVSSVSMSFSVIFCIYEHIFKK